MGHLDKLVIDSEDPTLDILRDFAITGDFELYIDDRVSPDAEIFRSEPAAAYLVRTSEFDFILLVDIRGRSIQSIDRNDLPKEAVDEGKPTFRSITMDGEEIEFSGGFTDLHTVIYKETLAGNGFGLEDARPSIDLAHQIRNATPIGINDNAHPFLLK